MFSIFKPATHQPLIAADRIDSRYRQLRWQIFLGIFIDYAAYYLIRKKLCPCHALAD